MKDRGRGRRGRKGGEGQDQSDHSVTTLKFVRTIPKVSSQPTKWFIEVDSEGLSPEGWPLTFTANVLDFLCDREGSRVDGSTVMLSELSESFAAVCDSNFDVANSTPGSRVLNGLLDDAGFNFLVDIHAVMEPY